MKQLKLSEDRIDALTGHLQTLYDEAFDQTLSVFQAEQIIALMLEKLGPAVYNQAVEDVRAHLQGKLDDLAGEVWIDSDI